MSAQMNLDLRARFASAMANSEPDVLEGPAPTATPRPGTRRGASEKQRGMIHTMIAERYPADQAEAEFSSHNFDTMTRVEFDKLFRELKAMGRIDARVKASTQSTPVAQNTPAPVATELPEGRFTMIFEDESYRTLRVRRQSDDANFMPGRLIVGYLSGSDNESDYSNFAHVTERGAVVTWKKHRDNAELAEAVKVLTGDPIACMKAYARQSGNCGHCGRVLTTPESLERLIGPVCAEKLGL